MKDTTPIHLRAIFDKLFERLANSKSSRDHFHMKAQILKILVEVSNVTSAYICRWYPDTLQTQVVAEHIGNNANYLERQSDLWDSRDEAEDGTLYRLLFEDKRPTPIMHVFDLPHDSLDRQNFLRYGACTVVFARILVDGDVWGYVEVWESRFNRTFSEDEASLFLYVAHKLSEDAIGSLY